MKPETISSWLWGTISLSKKGNNSNRVCLSPHPQFFQIITPCFMSLIMCGYCTSSWLEPGLNQISESIERRLHWTQFFRFPFQQAQPCMDIAQMAVFITVMAAMQWATLMTSKFCSSTSSREVRSSLRWRLLFIL